MQLLSPYSYGLNLAVASHAPPPAIVYSQGVHSKIEYWQQKSTSQMTAIANELATKTWLKGAMWQIRWWDHELSPGVFNKTLMEEFYAICADRGKMCTFLLSYREFVRPTGAVEESPILPQDLLTTAGTYSDGSIKYANMWAYKGISVDLTPPNGPPVYVTKGYNHNLFDVNIRARWNAFVQYIATHFDGRPYFAGIMFVESAAGEPLDGYAVGNSSDAHFAGMLNLYINSKAKFTKSQVIPDVNATTSFINDMFATPSGHALTYKLPWSTSNMFTISTGNVALVQSKTAALNGKLWIMSQIQAHDMNSVDGSIPGTPPTKEYLYLRARNTHIATHLYVQRNTPSSTPSNWGEFVAYMDSSPYADDPFGGLSQVIPENII